MMSPPKPSQATKIMNPATRRRLAFLFASCCANRLPRPPRYLDAPARPAFRDSVITPKIVPSSQTAIETLRKNRPNVPIDDVALLSDNHDGSGSRGFLQLCGLRELTRSSRRAPFTGHTLASG